MLSTTIHGLLSCLFSANIRYTRQNLLDIGEQHQISILSVFHYMHNIPDDIARPLVMLRLRKQPHKPPLLSLYLSNARSLVHKMDDLQLQLAGNRYVRDCCVLIITETWLHLGIPDASMQLAGRTLLHLGRTEDLSTCMRTGVIMGQL